MLRRMFSCLERVCISVYEHKLFRAAFALAFFGALCISELVSPSKTIPGGLMVGDLELWHESIRVWIRRSKTDQAGKGRYLEVGRIDEVSICPVTVVQSFLEIRSEFEGPLLIHEDGGFLSKFQFVAVFKKCMVRVGCDPR